MYTFSYIVMCVPFKKINKYVKNNSLNIQNDAESRFDEFSMFKIYLAL